MNSALEDQLKSHYFWKFGFSKGGIMTSFDKVGAQRLLVSVKLFYVLLTLLLLKALMHNFSTHIGNNAIEPIWAIKFVSYFPQVYWSVVFLIASIISSFLCLLYTEVKWVRIVTFIAFFLYTSLENSNGKINHGDHLVLIALFCFQFLCLRKESAIKDVIYYSSCLFLILSTYFVGSLFKLKAGIFQLNHDASGIFTLSCMDNLLGYQFLYEKPTFLANILLSSSDIYGFVFYWIGILVEFFVIISFFKGKYLMYVGCLLIGLHTGIALLLDVQFYNNLIVLIPLFVLNPLYTKHKFYAFLK